MVNLIWVKLPKIDKRTRTNTFIYVTLVDTLGRKFFLFCGRGGWGGRITLRKSCLVNCTFAPKHRTLSLTLRKLLHQLHTTYKTFIQNYSLLIKNFEYYINFISKKKTEYSLNNSFWVVFLNCTLLLLLWSTFNRS